MKYTQNKYAARTPNFSVSYQYPVCFTKDLFNHSNETLIQTIAPLDTKSPQKIFIFIDFNVEISNPGLKKKIREYFNKYSSRIELSSSPVILPGGESIKNSWDYVHEVSTKISDFHLDRHSFVMAIGGGAVLDLVGFAAAITHRGLKLVRIPTTTLSQNDGGVGVKTGINDYGQKNFSGTYTPPFAVINDFLFLKTLPFEHFIGGVAEAYKVAMIKEKPFFDFLIKNTEKLKSRDQEAIEKTVYQCALIHLDHIENGGDPFEFGSARPLDFGHWSAHKIESLSAYSIGHGQAVSIGIALDSFYAWKKELLSKDEFQQLITGLLSSGLPVWSEYLEMSDNEGDLEILEGLERFREHLGGQLTFTMPNGIGRKIELHEMDVGIVEDGIIYLKNIKA
ncbi:MAG: 3-dehydroquinate synthase [Desulfobacterales bacterium]|nr:3-dehydroquinate synthase [Desulfobacterales bacterium]